MIFTKKKKFNLQIEDSGNPPKFPGYPGWSLENGISQSFLSEWLACKERARLSYVEGWTSSETSNAITFGSLFHTCVEKIYRPLALGVKWSGIDIQTVIDNALVEFKKSSKMWTPDDENNYQLNTGYLKILVPKYCAAHLEKDSKTRWFSVEEEYDTELNGVRFRGKFDRLQLNKHDEVWVWDTKTKGRIDPTIQDRLSFDLQMMVYITAYEKISGKLPSGFVYDIIQRPGLRKGSTETLKHFMDRVKGDVDESYFHRIRIRLDEKEYRRWKTEFALIVEEFKRWGEGKTREFRNPAACETRYGLCRFIKVCNLNDFTGLQKKEKIFSELEVK